MAKLFRKRERVAPDDAGAFTMAELSAGKSGFVLHRGLAPSMLKRVERRTLGLLWSWRTGADLDVESHYEMAERSATLLIRNRRRSVTCEVIENAGS